MLVSEMKRKNLRRMIALVFECFDFGQVSRAIANIY